MVKPRIGWTASGDEYHIVGGASYVKEDDCYHVRLSRINRILEDWSISAKDLTIEELINKLEGPFEGEKGLFGRKFLEKYGKKRDQRRLPP